MSTRQQNERKFGNWQELSGGGRRYWYEVAGRQGWRARYLKEVDTGEKIVKFWQEVYDGSGQLVEFIKSIPLIRDIGRCKHHESHTQTGRR
jgi:hypothetical protein